MISRRAVGTFLAFATITGFVVLAATRDGYHTTATDLHDGTVWTISRDRDAVARINARVKEFDTRIRNEMDSADLYQDGKSVYLRLPEGIVPLNSTGTSIDSGLEPAEFEVGTQFGVAGGVAAALDAEGHLWVTTSSALAGIDPASTEPDTEVNPGSMLSVTPDGFVVVIDPVDDVVLVAKSDIGTAENGEPVFRVLEAEPFGHDVPTVDETADSAASPLQYTAVGGIAVVVWDGQLLVQSQEPIPLRDAATATLQQPGITSTDVLLADASGLWLAPLDGGEATLRVGGGEGAPAAPVVVGGCAYAGWAALGRVWRNCDGEDEVLDARVDDSAGTNWVFRVNRDEVVLEAEGVDPIQITDDGLVTVDNWTDFESELEEPDDSQSEEAFDQSEKAECKEGAAPPEAGDDSYGATPGVSVVLRVLDNDRDPNCDPIAIQDLPLLDPLTEGTIELIEQRQAIQYTPPDGGGGGASFGYTIDDGLEGASTATVRVVVDGTSNSPPEPKPGRQSTTIVELFRSVSYNVLFDWIDPNGDTLVLQSASLVDAGSGSITWGQGGTITYTATDTIAGPKEVLVVVSDGLGNTAEGTLEIAVQGEGVPLPPTARDDYVESPAGRELAISPLDNDTDPNNNALVLGRYDIPEGVVVSQGEGGVLRVTAAEPGTYLIPYEATDGNLVDGAAIRFEATPLDQPQRPPVAVRDSIVVQEGTSLNIDVLANDYDADGDVLILTDAVLRTEAQFGVTVDPIERRFVRVQVDQDPGQPIVVEYSISDGVNTSLASGQLVVNVAAPGSQRPEPADDAVRVRINDTVDVPILANDVDPDGDQLTLTSVALDPPDQPGLLWLDGRVLRYRAGAEGGRVTATYTVDDDPQNPGLSTGSAFVEITVVDSDPAENLPPTPPPLHARVFAGSEIMIAVPTAGIDPDGDSVEVVSIGAAGPNVPMPQLGVPTPRRNSIVYRANAGANGQDRFSYVVQDPFGATSIGSVNVVVVEAPNHQVVLVRDSVLARPGRELQVPVLSNDSDPDGDAITLESVDGPIELDAAINESRLELTLPAEEGTWQLTYSASDGKSPARTQVLTVVSDLDAPLLPAVARDDPDEDVEQFEIITTGDSSSAVVEVLANDDDPDGSRDELVVTIPDGQDVSASVLPTREIEVLLTDSPQAFVYSVADFDGNDSFAVVRVPPAPSAAVNRPPELTTPIDVAVVTEGDPTSIAIAGYVTDPDGDPVTLSGELPSSAEGDVALIEGDFSTFVFTALPFEGVEATVWVPVTDRPGEPAATVLLPFPVSVIKPNQPPIAEQYPLAVELFGTPATVDLVAVGAVTDVDGDSLIFELASSDSDVQGLAPSMSSSGVITVSAGEGARDGMTATFRYTVTDGQPDREPVSGSFEVSVVASTKPLVQLNPIARADLKQGQAERVEPLSGVTNPIPSVPLQITDASLVTGSGTVGFDATSVTYTPPPDFFGVAEVRYTVIDGTGSLARQARGSITYSVIGRPLAPGQPRVTEVASHTATIEWIPADPQGSPITDYLVTWPGGQVHTGGATNATISSLINNTPYTFTVSATNAVGTGPVSAPSQTVIPDEVPIKPRPPRVVTFGDGTLTVEWDEGVADGSPVFQYHVTLSGGETKVFGARTRSVVWPGLENGREYTFSVVAENNAGRSEPSALSNSLSPARQPEVPGTPTVTDVGNNLTAAVSVSWPRPPDNGRPIDGYEIVSTMTGQVYTSGTESIVIQLPPGQNASFTVRAHNVVGWSGYSPASAAFEAIVEPSAPPAMAVVRNQSSPATVLEGDKLVTIYAGSPSSNGGSPIIRYEYSISGSGWLNLGGPSGVHGGLTNGTGYYVVVRACNKKFCGPASPTAGPAIPSGPPTLGTGTLTHSGPYAGQDTFTLCWDTSNAYNGSPIVSRTIEIWPKDNLLAGRFINSSNVATTGCEDYRGRWDTQYTFRLEVTDEQGRVGPRQLLVTVGSQP